MEGKWKFVVHGRKEGDNFILEGITNFIMKSLESYDGKLIIVTFGNAYHNQWDKIDKQYFLDY